jgi:CopG family transcriptional regulator, nickel-responsive regulator
VGTITLVYDHHVRLLSEKLTDIQHHRHAIIISTVHSRLDYDTCLEVVVVKGKSPQVQKLADVLISCKGVRHGGLVLSTPSLSRPSGNPLLTNRGCPS